MTITTIKQSTQPWNQGANAPEAYLKVRARRAAGQPWKVALRDTGLNYSQAWQYIARCEAVEGGTAIDLDPNNVPKAKQVIADLRAKGLSWGAINVLTGIPESLARNLFTEATNVDHQGLRNGHGGRFYQGKAEAYAPAPKIGWVRPKGDNVDLPAFIKAELLKAGVGEGEASEIASMSLRDLRSMAKSLGLPTAGTKKDLAERVGSAFAE